MGRKINEDKYGISDRRYRELVYFCLQYKEWKEWLGHNDGTVPGQAADVIPGGHGKHSDPVAALAIKREQLQNKCKILEKAAERGEDKPVKQWDHCLDSVMYFLYTIVRKPAGIHILK